MIQTRPPTIISSTAIISLMLLIVATLISFPTLALDFSLETVQSNIEKKYNKIDHIDGRDFLNLNKENTIVFDVRQQNEFDISHIKSATRISPNIENDVFINKFGDKLKEKNIIFYCSVGQRSSSLASRLQPFLLALGANEIYNLKGGIFKWHNEKRALVLQGHPTNFIHPFNTKWGLLLDDKQSIRFLPNKKSE